MGQCSATPRQEAVEPFGFYEFFAGGGMARLGLGASWKCLFANDFDAKKVAAYRRNFDGAPELVDSDIKDVRTAQLPGNPFLAWASFPCQDVSLAGYGAGLAGERSAVFWPFWTLMLALKQERRNPPIIVLENVAGLITSHGGRDLSNIISVLVDTGYRVGALMIDGTRFVAQSRPRLFIVAVVRAACPQSFLNGKPTPIWHPPSLQDLVARFSFAERDAWVWWNLPQPDRRIPRLSDVIENEPHGVVWHSVEETTKLLSMMSPPNLNKVRLAQRLGKLQVGTVYKRSRQGVQRAEVRFDGVSGCLRTPSGGSSRQIIMVIEGRSIRSRLISPRETARLMGLPENYILPERYNDAYHLAGDGVIVPAVSWLEQHILRPLAMSAKRRAQRSRMLEQPLCQAHP